MSSIRVFYKVVHVPVDRGGTESGSGPGPCRPGAPRACYIEIAS